MHGYVLPPNRVEQFSPAPLRDRGLLESALAAPLASWEGCELYGSVIDKASVLLERMVHNHPFFDGNKRAGWRSCLTYLEINGVVIVVDPCEAVRFIEAVAANQIEHEEVVLWLAEHVEV